MIWTIQTAVQGSEDMKKLKAAIDSANIANILMFCSSSDQGANNKEDCFPGDSPVNVGIGGATFTGEKLTWVDEKVNFWFPGRNVPFLLGTASWLLAGVLLYNARLLHGNKLKNKDTRFQDRTAMVNAITVMAKGVDGKFPRTDDILNKMFKKKIQQTLQKTTKKVNINTLGWSKVYKKALEALLNHIQLTTRAHNHPTHPRVASRSQIRQQGAKNL
ncbi:hypothetical protein V502_08058 [Pseudogymnoascus sp. VKM F-4520 (FW-2644)]|nr:hypothetical protein V502_08058 [Pseudogymnoascus sp. VKM F-4520 (FW-2644)]